MLHGADTRRWPVTLTQWATATVAAIAILGAWASAARAASTAITAFTLSAASNQAGGSPALTTALTFAYATSGDTAQSVSVTLPPGMQLAPASVTTTCSSAELTAHTCPAASVIGTGAATFTTSGLLGSSSASATITLYEMPAPSSADIGGIGADFASNITLATDVVASGPIDVATSSSGQPAIEVSLTDLPSSFSLLGLEPEAATLNSLSLTFNGQSTTDADYTRLPDSCTAASATASMTTVDKATASGTSSSLTPSGCSSLIFAPAIAAAAAKDPSDAGVAFVAKISQSATDATAKSIALTMPSDIALNAVSGSALCPSPNATFSNCTKLGAVGLATPLVTAPLVGGLYLTGSASAPELTVAFPSPFAFSFSGALNTATDTVSFTGVPDVPTSALVLDVTAGASGLFTSTCKSTSGTLTSAFTDQNGDTPPETPSATVALAGCPATSTTTTTPPTIKPAGPPHLRTHVVVVKASGKATVSFTLAAGTNAPDLAETVVQLPSGLSFVASKIRSALTLSGTGVKAASIVAGKLVIAFTAATTKVSVQIGSTGLKVAKSLLAKTVKVTVKSDGTTKIEHKKTKFTLRTEQYAIDAIDAKDVGTLFTESAKV